MPAKGFQSEQKERLQTAVSQGWLSAIARTCLDPPAGQKNETENRRKIADFIGCGYRTAYWCVHGNPTPVYDETNARLGNYRKATGYVYRATGLKVVEIAPSELGYEFGRWTANDQLLIYQTGIELSSKQISRILQKKKKVCLISKIQV